MGYDIDCRCGLLGVEADWVRPGPTASICAVVLQPRRVLLWALQAPLARFFERGGVPGANLDYQTGAAGASATQEYS